MARSGRAAKRRRGMPARGSVVEEKPFLPPRQRAAGRAAVALGAERTYRILRTSEVDPYDKPLARTEVASFGVARFAGLGDAFAGKSRRATKLSIANAPTTSFADLRALIEALPADQAMIARKPRITVGHRSRRVSEEKRNVRVRAFLYAASREDDNDYHLIIGRARSASQPMYMTVEISGLPPKTSTHYTRLKAARDAYKAFFTADLPGASYDFYDPPIPVEVEGSLFFDMTHASGGHPGPKSLRDDIPTIWEIHPVSRIVFEP